MSGFGAKCHETTAIFKQGGKASAKTGASFWAPSPGPRDGAGRGRGDRSLRNPVPCGQGLQGHRGELARQTAITAAGLAETTVHPTKVEPAGPAGMRIVWDDAHESPYAYRALRLACPCAACVDEFTGEKRLDPATVPADVHAVKTGTIGRYALNFRWSDGHDSGIYTYARLRALCECSACKKTSASAAR